MDLNLIFSELPFKIIRYKSLSGGDINNSFWVETENGNFFLKLNRAKPYPQMFRKEANGLLYLSDSGFVSVPKVIATGESNNIQYLVLEWIADNRSKTPSWEDFGVSLAKMHQIVQPCFGFKEDNYIGSIKQINTPSHTWEEFYSECRILKLAHILFNQKKIGAQELKQGQNVCKKLNEIFPEEKPALLHGDLWSGNYLVSSNNKIVLIDPAVYYGHREMDLGMTLLFGGFPSCFYEAYSEEYSLEKNWKQRLPLTQLYPLMVHAILFNGNYLLEVKKVLKKFS
ncbi:fructosamine kinase family protein [Apibacter sp. HY039]|uniref:fructosamine kinase family protein n=1 Tax=Apibacter sp. HY039 TaxID=2501476 RepID=UPI000FEB7A62|nr:fructosamine kinase family protein [Apibacter sp. HY039]